MRKYFLLLLMAFGISLQIFSPAFAAPTQFSTEEAEVIIFHPGSEAFPSWPFQTALRV